MRSYTTAQLRALLPYPAADANKYTRGHLVMVTGCASYPGAACLSAGAAQRTGAGYTEVFTENANVAKVQAFGASLVVRPFESLDFDALPMTKPGKPCAYVVGSGFDAHDRAGIQLTNRTLAQAKAPVLVDGGALHALTAEETREICLNRAQCGDATVLTPHGGEAAALARALGVATDDPIRLANDLACAYGAVVVLKGPDTILSDGRDVWTMTEGTSALAKAGTGDVLAGIIGALLAQALDAFDACALGSVLHARAGRIAADEVTEIAVLAEDVLACIPDAVLDLEWEEEE